MLANLIGFQVRVDQKVDYYWQLLVHKVLASLLHADKNVAIYVKDVFNLVNGRVAGNGFVDDLNKVSADGAGDDIFGCRL